MFTAFLLEKALLTSVILKAQKIGISKISNLLLDLVETCLQVKIYNGLWGY